LFATVPGSSINSWDSWFIFNLRKNKHLLLHDILHDIFVHGKGQKRMLAVTSNLRIHQQCNHGDFQDVNFSATLAVRLAVVEIPLYNLHTI
jgi:hypothetical protein